MPRSVRRRAAELWFTEPIGAWRSLVARTVRVGEVPGSNPGAPIAYAMGVGGRRRGRIADRRAVGVERRTVQVGDRRLAGESERGVDVGFHDREDVAYPGLAPGRDRPRPRASDEDRACAHRDHLYDVQPRAHT